MSKYTTEVRFICEHNAGLSDSVGYSDVDNVIQRAIPKIFDFDFPIFDEDYRNILCTKILRHYYTREICEETVGLWKLRLETKLNEIMPYYNKLYKSELIEFNPLYDTDITTEHSGTKDASNVGTDKGIENETTQGGEIVNSDKNSIRNKVSTGESTENAATDTTNISNEKQNTSDVNYDLYSDTPQGGIEGIDGWVTDEVATKYLTNARKKTDSASSTAQNEAVGAAKSETTGTIDNNEKEDNIDFQKIDRTESGSKQRDSEMQRSNFMRSTDEYVLKVQGKNGGKSFSEMLQEFRKTFLNIDMMIIDNLSGLFFNLW